MCGKCENHSDGLQGKGGDDTSHYNIKKQGNERITRSDESILGSDVIMGEVRGMRIVWIPGIWVNSRMRPDQWCVGEARKLSVNLE
jgi:hypothetical protein